MELTKKDREFLEKLQTKMKEKTKEKKQPENYIHTVYCSNCGDAVDWAIPYGKLIDDFVKDKICENCGCKLREEDKR